MLEILFVLLFLVVFIKAAGLALKITWGAAKTAACLLFVIALPLLIVCLLFAGGLVLLLPVALVVAALGILKAA